MTSPSRTLKNWRQVRHLSQRKLAERSGVGYVSIARLESAKLDPRFSTLEKLAKGLGIAVTALIAGPKAAMKATVRRRRQAVR